MVSLLLAIIYLSFISLGLPDGILGSAWPVMYPQLSVPVSYMGIVTMIIAAGTIVSSLLSDRLTKALGVGMVTAVSVAMTAGSLFLFSVTDSFAYQRNEDGYLCSVRISDYAGHEAEIDWTKTEVSREEAYSINLVDEFHGGCGMKPQEEY